MTGYYEFFLLWVCLLSSVTGIPVSSRRRILERPPPYNQSKNSALIPSNEPETSTKIGALVRESDVVSKQGVCDGARRPLIYTENFVLENDKKSQILASVRIGISGRPNITCVELISRSNDVERPSILSGGVGNNYVDVGVKPDYGKGFNFSVKLYGSYYSNELSNEEKT